MQTQMPNYEPSRFPMEELERVESAMQASQLFIETLRRRHDALTEELERITRPNEQPATSAKPLTVGPGFVFRGAITRCYSFIDIHAGLLGRLWTDFPERREVMANAMSSRGRSRTYVALTRAGLFQDKAQAWVERFSRPLMAGWFIDTNLSRRDIQKLLAVAVEAAGLEWGKEVQVYWRATEVRPDPSSIK